MKANPKLKKQNSKKSPQWNPISKVKNKNSKKSSSVFSARNSKKRINSKVIKSKSAKRVYREIQKSLDNALLVLPPKVQENIDQAIKSLERSAFCLQDLRSIGLSVLRHATEISNTIKGSSKENKNKKRMKA